MRRDLRQIEREVNATIRELDRELTALRVASQAVREPEQHQLPARAFRSHDDADSLSNSCSRDVPSATKAAAAAENTVVDCQKRLLDHQTTLSKHLGNWKRDLDTLLRGRIQGSVASAKMREAQDGARESVQAISKLLDAVAAALDRAQRVSASAPGRRAASVRIQRQGFQSNAPHDLGATLVTLETVPLLDIYRSGGWGHRGWGVYPTPQLGSLKDDRGSSLCDKVLAGLGLLAGDMRRELAVEMPSFYRAWFRNGRIPADGAERTGDQ